MLRQIWCEGSFAAQKARHNLRCLYRRGLEAAEEHCLLSAMALNLKRMVSCLGVLSGLWVLQEKVDTRVSTFSLPNHFLFLGIYGIIELSKDERR